MNPNYSTSYKGGYDGQGRYEEPPNSYAYSPSRQQPNPQPQYYNIGSREGGEPPSSQGYYSCQGTPPQQPYYGDHSPQHQQTPPYQMNGNYSDQKIRHNGIPPSYQQPQQQMPYQQMNGQGGSGYGQPPGRSSSARATAADEASTYNPQAAKQYDTMLKFIIIGDEGVGKTCLLLQFTDSKFRKTHQITVGVEFGSKIEYIDGKAVKLQIWDTAGQDRFRSIIRGYYRGAAAALLVYDITQRDTFAHVSEWIKELWDEAGNQTAITLVGNKCDCDDRRQVSYEEGHYLSQQYGLSFIETSAHTGEWVHDAFMETAKLVIKNQQQIMIDNGDFGRDDGHMNGNCQKDDGKIRLGQPNERQQQEFSQSSDSCCA